MLNMSNQQKSNWVFSVITVVLLLIAVILVVLTPLLNPSLNHDISILDVELFYGAPSSVREVLEKSYLPGSTTTDEDVLINDFDPRLVVAIWVRMIYNQVSRNGSLSSFKIPFHWGDMIDTEAYNRDSGEAINNALKKTNNSDQVDYIIGPIDQLLGLLERKIIGVNYLLNWAPIPRNVVLLGICSNGAAMKIQTANSNTTIDLVVRHENENVTRIDYGISLIEELVRLRSILKKVATNGTDQKLKLIDKPSFDAYVGKDDFKFNLTPISTDRDDHAFEAEFERNAVNPNQPKFFYEALVEESTFGGHYDWRFFQKLEYSDYERKAILHRLTRAWLRFANSVGIKTWLAHGTLMGWYWNGMNLPWDQDVDVQVPAMSLLHMAKFYNQSIVIDLSEDNQPLNIGIGKYFLEVSPSFAYRKHGNGENNIDARFIDVSTGMYVDITGLAITDGCNDIEFDDSNEFNQVLDEHFLEKKGSLTIAIEELKKEWTISRDTHFQNQDLVNCRDNHYYRLDELSPLRRTLFEGVMAFVPQAFGRILTREYPKGLWKLQFADHIFRPVSRLWAPKRVCKHDELGNSCHDKQFLLEFKHTEHLTWIHKQQKLVRFKEPPHETELLSIRVDPWILERYRKVCKVVGDVTSA